MRARVLLLFRREAAESRMDDEFRFHIEMEANRIVRETGVGTDEARRQALVAFGGVEKHKEDLRDGRGLHWVSGMGLDLKLGVRMLARYPGLTFVGCLALAVAVGAGAAYLETLNDAYHSKLPVANGERVVMIQNWNVAERHRDQHLLHDYTTWRTELTGLQELGALQSAERNLITGDGHGEPVAGSEISASAFRIMQARPLLGRTLLDSDERPGATPVLVLGYDVWQSRFGGDSTVVGTNVRWGDGSYTIVGVAPRGFAFPDNKQLWVPFRLSAANYTRGSGPPLNVFGLLEAETDLATVQAQLTAIGRRTSADFPETNRNLRPLIKPYMEWLVPVDANDRVGMQVLYWLNLFFVALLCVCGSNVATLVFARTATRESELSIRTALGASRMRIVTQLVAEALVLTSTAAIVGLGAAYFAMRSAAHSVIAMMGSSLPFWWNDALSPVTIGYALVLALLAAVIVGAVPALKATGQQVQSGLKHGAAGGSLEFGRLWTGVIVSQVALTVLFLFVVATVGWNVHVGRYMPMQVSLPTREFMTARLATEEALLPNGLAKPLDGRTSRRLDASFAKLEQQLLSQPGVIGMTYTSRLPGEELERMTVEIDVGSPAGRTTPNDVHDARTVRVDPEFFATVNRPVDAGRAFSASDAQENRNVVLVDQSFVRFVLGNHNAIGQRIRQAAREQGEAPGPWREIIGVVSDLTVAPDKLPDNGVVYVPSTAGEAYPTFIVVHTSRDAAGMARHLRMAAATVDPTLRLYNILPLSEIGRDSELIFSYILRGLFALGAVALLLSSAGIYSLTAFTVARRTREIGIRVALGAEAPHVVREVFSPSLRKVGLGIVLGSIPGIALVAFGAPEVAEGAGGLIALATATAVALFTSVVALIASYVPVRRALRIQPVEALSA